MPWQTGRGLSLVLPPSGSTAPLSHHILVLMVVARAAPTLASFLFRTFNLDCWIFFLPSPSGALVLSYAIVFDTVNTSQDVRRDARGILTFSLFAPIQIACVSCDFLKVNLNPKQLIVRSLHCWILRYSITIDNY